MSDEYCEITEQVESTKQDHGYLIPCIDDRKDVMYICRRCWKAYGRKNIKMLLKKYFFSLKFCVHYHKKLASHKKGLVNNCGVLWNKAYMPGWLDWDACICKLMIFIYIMVHQEHLTKLVTWRLITLDRDEVVAEHLLYMFDIGASDVLGLIVEEDLLRWR